MLDMYLSKFNLPSVQRWEYRNLLQHVHVSALQVEPPRIEGAGHSDQGDSIETLAFFAVCVWAQADRGRYKQCLFYRLTRFWKGAPAQE